jgi:hypothetical protein
MLELGLLKQEETITLLCDNQSSIKLVNNQSFIQSQKHMEIQHQFIREKVEDGSINVEYIPTSQQLADIFTKPRGRTRFKTLGSAISVISIDNLSRE